METLKGAIIRSNPDKTTEMKNWSRNLSRVSQSNLDCNPMPWKLKVDQNDELKQASLNQLRYLCNFTKIIIIMYILFHEN